MTYRQKTFTVIFCMYVFLAGQILAGALGALDLVFPLLGCSFLIGCWAGVRLIRDYRAIKRDAPTV